MLCILPYVSNMQKCSTISLCSYVMLLRGGYNVKCAKRDAFGKLAVAGFFVALDARIMCDM